MSDEIRTRFAPSPTGFLHVGGARTALYNWLFAKKMGGKFILRIEDTDEARNTTEATQAIFDGMLWLGIDWDEGPKVSGIGGGDCGPYFQSERREIYDRYLDQLVAADLAYEDDGAMRFRVPDREILVNDVVCGEVRTNLKEQGSTRWDAEKKENVPANPDLVIRRPDGSYIFHFVNVVDDIEMRLTHVIRGEDHLPNTAKHVALFEALGKTPPIYAHIPLNLNADGSKMSKRDEGAAIGDYLKNGYLPEAVNNYMALLGWSSKSDQEIFSTEQLVEAFSLEGINQSNSRFDIDKCKWVNAEHLKALTEEEWIAIASPFLDCPANDSRLKPALDLARERVQTLGEISALLSPIFNESIVYDETSVAKVSGREGIGALMTGLATHLSDVESWKADEIKQAIVDAAKSLDVKMGALMLPCRVASSGSTDGPDLLPMLELIGQERVVERVQIFASMVG